MSKAKHGGKRLKKAKAKIAELRAKLAKLRAKLAKTKAKLAKAKAKAKANVGEASPEMRLPTARRPPGATDDLLESADTSLWTASCPSNDLSVPDLSVDDAQRASDAHNLETKHAARPIRQKSNA